MPFSTFSSTLAAASSSPMVRIGAHSVSVTPAAWLLTAWQTMQ
jgi:hypothetical protein